MYSLQEEILESRIIIITINHLYPRDVIPFQPGLYRPDLHYRGEWPGIHYVAFTKIPLVHSYSLGFASRINIVLLPKVGN
jgi:hypothetical protein